MKIYNGKYSSREICTWLDIYIDNISKKCKNTENILKIKQSLK